MTGALRRQCVGECYTNRTILRSDQQIDVSNLIAFADEAFGIENEEMTPSLKIRRHKLKERYGERLDGLYKG